MIRRLATTLQRRFDGFDTCIENTAEYDHPAFGEPVFIVGAPRTGSTLLFQMLLGSVDFAFVSNLMALAPRHIVKTAKLTRLLRRPVLRAREGHYGYLSGVFSPNEAGHLCTSWFGGATAADRDLRIRRTMNAIAFHQRGPLLLKNVKNSLRIPRIRELCPGARFVDLTRDSRFTAQSIVLARRALLGSGASWWSVEPPGHMEIAGRDPMYQVAWQVLRVRQILAQDLDGVEVARIRYEDLCERPAEAIESLARRWNLELTNDPGLLGAQPGRNTRLLNQREWRLLERALAEAGDALSESPTPAGSPDAAGRSRHVDKDANRRAG